MGNRVCIYLTKFTDIDLRGVESHIDFGLRVADDYDNTYRSGFAEREIVGNSPMEIVEMAREIDDRARDMIAFSESEHDGIEIDGEFFLWSDINPAVKTP